MTGQKGVSVTGRHVKILVAFFALLGGACDCKGSGVGLVNPGVCDRDFECPAKQSYRKGVCVTDRCDSRGRGDSDCCPGQICTVDGRCTNKHETFTCTQDADCGAREAGRICLSRPELNGAANVCSFPIPSETGACPVTYRLFNKRCIRELPCGGGCPDTELCNIETNECETIPSIPTSNADCDVSCGNGTIKTLADPDSMIFGQCCALACLCEALPPLFEGVYGRFADATVTSNAIYASSYNATYGDLVVSTHDKTTGNRTKLEFVDGFPSGGKLGGDPNGPRKGESEAGPDVGFYTSITAGADGQPRVAYYDVTNKDLKYAERTADGTWVNHVVDSVGDVGLYTTIEFSSNKLRIAYFAKAVPGNAGDNTMLRYAEAKVASPRGAGDWTIVDATPPRPLRKPCNNSCASGDACFYVDTPGPAVFSCGKVASDCVGTAPAGKVCGTPNGGTKGFYAQDPIPQTEELANGVGLFPSMIQKDDKLYIAYLDNYTGPATTPPFTLNNGTLKGIIAPLTGGSAATFSAPVTLDNGSTCAGEKRNVGAFASISLSSDGRIGIAYADSSDRELRLYGPPPGDTFVEDTGCFETSTLKHANNRIFIVDTGIATATTGVTFVGADASLYFNPTNKPYIAFQDQTNLDVRVAGLKSDGTWQVDYLSQDKGDGFETQLLSEGSKTWLLSVQVGRDSLGNPTDRMVIRPVILPTLP